MPQLTWVGKDKVKNHHHDVPFHLLDKLYDFQSDNSKQDNRRDNLLIHGDNLLALKSLLPEFGGRVDCIYIDPPYNTGNEGWVYNDNVNDPRIQQWLGEVVGKEGEDLSRHDKWLCMMYPRLKLLKQLLADDGVIFISIDDNEQAALKLICDEVFGRNRFVAQIPWRKRTAKSDVPFGISQDFESILCYSKSDDFLAGVQGKERRYYETDDFPNRPWRTHDLTTQRNAEERPNSFFTMINPKTGKEYPANPLRTWAVTQDTFQEYYDAGKIVFPDDYDFLKINNPVMRYFKDDDIAKAENAGKTFGQVAVSTLLPEKVGMTQDGTKEITEIFGSKIFNFPKPSSLIEYLLEVSTDKTAIILDSFAGSGTTAHAVLNLNKRDGGNRRFVCVELMDYAEQTTAERIRRVINGYGSKPETQGGTGGGFAFYRVGDALFDAERNLNPAAPVAAVRRYIAYTEGLPVSALPECERQPENQKQPESPVSPYFLGVNNGTGYLFHYEPDRATDLSFYFLKTIHLETLPEKPERWVVYADRTLLSDEQMKQLGIIFKRIPRDISKL